MIGPLDVVILERSLAEIFRRHEVWRTKFEERARQVAAALLPSVAVTLTAIDLRGLAAELREAEAVRMVEEQLRRSELFAAGPMVRPMLVRMADNEHRLYLMAHLMVLDGVSAYQILPSELASLYSAFAAGKPSPLAELPLQFSDFAHAQRERLKAETAKQTAYWRSRLQDAPALEKREQSAFRGVIRRFAVPAEVSEAIKRTSRQENSTLFLTLLAVFAALLRQRTKDNDVVVGTLSPAGRKRSEFQGLLGYFLNPVALRFRFEDNPTFHELLGQTRKAMSEAMANDDVPIEQLASELLPGGASGHNPFFSAAISLQPPMPTLDLPQGLSMTVTTMDVDSGGSPWDLYLAFIDSADGLAGRVQFNPDLFDESGVENLINQFHHAAAVLTADSGRRISQLKASIQA
jgi:aspartate racemase